MPRKRSNRLAATLGTFVEELTHAQEEQAAAAVALHARAVDTQIAELRAELRRLEKRIERVSAARAGRPARDARRCKVEGCFQPHVARGFCKNHYQQTRYREKKISDARAAGKRYTAPKPGERRPGRKPKVPLPF
jgi:hypothetical protein